MLFVPWLSRVESGNFCIIKRCICRTIWCANIHVVPIFVWFVELSGLASLTLPADGLFDLVLVRLPIFTVDFGQFINNFKLFIMWVDHKYFRVFVLLGYVFSLSILIKTQCACLGGTQYNIRCFVPQGHCFLRPNISRANIVLFLPE